MGNPYSPGRFRYYRILIRRKQDITPVDLERIKEMVWEYLGDIGKIDIMAKKINKPGNLKFGGS